MVWPTLVLESIVKEAMATRADVSDAALALRAECVMPDKGFQLMKVVSFLDQIQRRMDCHPNKKSAWLVPFKSPQGPQPL